MEAFPKKVVNFNIPIHSQVLALSINQDKGMELDVQKSLSKFTVSKNLFPKPLDGAKIVLQYSEWVMSSLKKKSFFQPGLQPFFSLIHSFYRGNIFPKKVKIYNFTDNM